ncbi:MAG TPA: NADH-quinone oxidoreductase subunit N [Thermoanaerobaculia bacterium]|nr:NADH-quinone oxidoreductase subunit N [Thermoanaerobaculia bacterium]
MNRADLISILPEMILTGGGIVIVLLDALLPGLRRGWTAVALATTAISAWAAWFAWGELAGGKGGGGAAAAGAVPSWNRLLETSGVTVAFSVVILVATALCLLASQGYLRREKILSGEYHALLLWCAAGMLLMLRSIELLTVFLSLELLSIALYCLAAYHRKVNVAVEAAIKYFLMGAFVSAFVLYGIALVYGASGSTRFEEIGQLFAGGHGGVSGHGSTLLASLGLLLLVAGFGFKMSLVPFHAWSPDTYQGAPSPFVAFLSVAPKVASALVLYRLLALVAPSAAGARWSGAVALLSALSMVVGNLLALAQSDIKRMLAYSGIAHMGYLLLALVTLSRESLTPVIVYLLAYALMNAGAFTVVSMLYSRPGGKHDMAELAGWGYRFPLLGGCLAVCMLSLGGIPPTMGFLGKYLVFLNAIAAGHVKLAVLGVATSLVGVFYYLRVVYILYMRPESRHPEGLLIDGWGRAAAVLAALATIVLGLFPSDLLQWLIVATGAG